MNNPGPYLFCGLVCIWPMLFAGLVLWAEHRIQSHGWRGLIPRLPRLPSLRRKPRHDSTL
jgi:hypothetical protein